MRRRYGLALGCLALAACGSNPVRPATQQPPILIDPPVLILPGEFSPGAYRLMIFAGTAADLCAGEPSLSFQGGTVIVDVTVVRDGEGWLARAATPADGDLELRFRPATFGAGAGVGAVRGAGEDYLKKTSLLDRGRVTVRGAQEEAAPVTEVRVIVTDRTAIGQINGAITFESRGSRVTCGIARWILRPPDS